MEGIEFTKGEKSWPFYICTYEFSLCFVPTVMFTCHGRCCIRILAQTHTHTHTYIVQTDTRAKDVVERLLEDSPFSRKNVNFSVEVEKGEGKKEKENRQKRIDPRTNGQRANPDVLTILYRIRRGEYSFVGKIDSSIDAHPPSYPVDQESRYSIGFVFDSVLRKHRKFHG